VNADVQAPARRNLGLAALTLAASAGTLVCCVLPATMVALGAGATLAGLVSVVPQLIWLSEHKPLVFGTAVLMLLASGIALWRARRLPCPADPVLARTCGRLRAASVWLWWIAMSACAIGAAFAFVLPALR
jgi:hypothetical protein